MSKHGYPLEGLLRRLGVATAVHTGGGEGISASKAVAAVNGASASEVGNGRAHMLTKKTILILVLLCIPGAWTFGLIRTNAAHAAGTEHWGALGAFGSAGSGAGQFNEPSGVAVNDATTGPNAGDVYVVDKGNNRVEWFSSTGKYEGQFNGSATPAGSLSEPEGIAVDNSTEASKEDVYVIDKGHDVIDKFEAQGKYLGQLTGTCPSTGVCSTSTLVPFAGLAGVAVDSKGVVWVENGAEETSNPTIDTFSDAQPNAYLAGHRAMTGGGVDSGLAVDSEDNLYVRFQGIPAAATKLNSSGELIGEREIGGIFGVSGLAVDPSSDDLYLDTGSSVSVFDPAETFVESFGAGFLHNAGYLAVDPAAGPSGYVYIAQPAANDVVFLEHSATLQSPPITPVTEKAEPVTATSATFHGKLKLAVGEAKTGYYFEYNAGATCTGELSARTPFQFAEGTGEVGVSEVVTGLEPRVEYTVCLVADRFGHAQGSEQPFTTLPAAPEVIAESVSNTENEFAQFAAVINSNNSEQETTYSWEYSTEGSVAANTLAGSIKTARPEGTLLPEVFAAEEVRSKESELVPVNATFYYRVVATNATGTEKGKVQEYTKLPASNGERASELTLSSADLHAQVNPEFQETKYEFEYSTSKTTVEDGHGTPVPGGELPRNEGPLPSALCKDGNPPTLSREVFVCEDESTPACANTATPTRRETRLVCLDPVTIALADLEANKVYYYRVVLENESSENPANVDKGVPVRSPVEQFTTESLPIVSTGAAANIIRSSATLAGTVTPLDQTTTYYFQYISEAAYQGALAKGVADPYEEGQTTATLTLPASSEPQPVGPAAANGLLPETPYRYRLAAKNMWGIRYGKEATFTTTGKLLPGAETGAASAITQNTATLAGSVTTNGLQTNYGFEIGTEPNTYGPATGLGAIGGSLTEEVHVTLGELQPATTYYYRVTATNADGTVQGQPGTFTTPGFPTLISPPASPPLIAYTSPGFPKEEKPSGTTGKVSKSLTNKQKLAKALKACRKDQQKSRQRQCERQAHKRYPTANKKGK